MIKCSELSRAGVFRACKGGGHTENYAGLNTESPYPLRRSNLLFTLCARTVVHGTNERGFVPFERIEMMMIWLEFCRCVGIVKLRAQDIFMLRRKDRHHQQQQNSQASTLEPMVDVRCRLHLYGFIVADAGFLFHTAYLWIYRRGYAELPDWVVGWKCERGSIEYIWVFFWWISDRDGYYWWEDPSGINLHYFWGVMNLTIQMHERLLYPRERANFKKVLYSETFKPTWFVLTHLKSPSI